MPGFSKVEHAGLQGNTEGDARAKVNLDVTESAYSCRYAELNTRNAVLWRILRKNFRDNPLRERYLEVLSDIH